MATKYSLDDFIAKAIGVHGPKYDYSKAIYINSKSKLIIVCPDHGDFEQRACHHIQGQGCPKCKLLKLGNIFSSTTELFISKSSKIHNHKYDYSEVDYKNVKTKVKIICPIHGDFYQTPNSHLRGKGCPVCGLQRDRITFEEFLIKAQAVHNNYYEYIEFNNLCVSDKIRIICVEHGEFFQSIRSHLAGHGCHYCSYNIASRDERIRRFNEIHNNRYNYDEIGSDVRYHKKISITCYVHGIFEQTVGNHLAGHGCPKCNIVGGFNKLDIESFINKANSKHDVKYAYNNAIYVNNRTKLSITCDKHGDFQQSPSNHLAGNGCPICALSSSSSKAEDEIIAIIPDEYLIIRHDRELIAPYELDILVPQAHLAIEYHGDYFHSFNRSESVRDKFKHYYKHDLCKQNSIKLFQFFEYEWNNKRNIIESMLRHQFRLSKRIYARDCDIICDDDTTKFFEDNHLYGNRYAHVNICLKYNDHIVCAMSFSKHKQYGWEVIRFANLVNHSVVGGSGRLFKYFISKYGAKSVLTYADRRYSTGGLYIQLGFNEIGITRPGYKYWKSGRVLSRQQCQKSKLRYLLEHFDANLSESDNMFNNGYRRLWDAGNYKLLWIKDENH